MYANLKSLKFETSASGFIRIVLENDTTERPMTTVFTIAEAEHALKGWLGTSEFNPYFDDINYLTKFAGDGIKMQHFDGGCSRRIYGTEDYEQGRFSQELYFIFPAHQAAHLLALTISVTRRLKAANDKNKADSEDLSVPYYQRPQRDSDLYNARWEYTVYPETIQAWARLSAPKIRVQFEREAARFYKEAMHDSRNLHPFTLKSDVRRLARIAKNVSDGDVVTVHISPDHAERKDIPMSFYWWIEKNGQRYFNGGIIAHPTRAQSKESAEKAGLEWPEDADENYQHRPIKGYEYSTHT